MTNFSHLCLRYRMFSMSEENIKIITEFVHLLIKRAGKMKPIMYYTAASPPCRCVLLLAKILNIELELKECSPLAGDTQKPEFLAINPQHTIPTVDDGGLILWESRAILAYFTGVYGKNSGLYPEDLRVRALVDQRMQFDLGTLYQRMIQYYIPTVFMGAPLDETKLAKLREATGWFDTMLKGREWAAAEQFTIADLTLIVTCSQMEAFGFDFTPYGRVKQWMARCKEYLEPYDYEEINASKSQILGEMFRKKLQNL